MPIQVIFVVVIGILFIYCGYLIFSRKAPNLLDLFLKQGVSYNDSLSAKIFGTIIIIAGIIVLLLPLILGIENMNI
ncbi:hypothetical protein [Evansella cellulosilytica]|uniref:Uncharacterized protein n=1 Tax=Evansella cellulosilytica (strain ATCC 21833 / DSM 2522 / FERM P-1141 / JCM 9156 / N-4) TaxID=649639 RepID=E6TQQ4_EVAC2|nr:hypothetical protein [Evansella cellulosilytica]ADU30565.1 hypothetical protein Bcell_2305 [Evansella cellulosilytica DSM 2522]